MKDTILGRESTYNSFMSPAARHMKDTFFKLPHMGQQATKIRHLSIQRIGEETFSPEPRADRNIAMSEIHPKVFRTLANKSTDMGQVANKTFTPLDYLNQVSIGSKHLTTEVPSKVTITPKIQSHKSYLDKMNKTFNLNTIGGK